MYYRYVKRKRIAKGRVWTDVIENGLRKIYLRCAGCYEIFEIGTGPGTVGYDLRISDEGDVHPCLICPHCDTHLFVRLVKYEKTDVPDVFVKKKEK